MKHPTILIATDFTERAEAAVEQGLRVARRLEAKVVLAHATAIARDVPPAHAAAEETAARWKDALQEAVSARRAALGDLGKRHADHGVRLSTRVLDGHPDEALVDAVEETHASLVVVGMGQPGLNGRPRLGSVGRAVLRMAPASVMVARPGGGSGEGFRRVLVPTDFSTTAEHALDSALDLVAEEGTIEVVHFWRPGPFVLPYVPDADDEVLPMTKLGRQLIANVARLGADLIESRESDRYLIDFSHAHGQPSPGIAARLAKSEFDLVVLGSHGYRGLRRWLIGSVAETTARDAPCSVMVVKPVGGEEY